MIFGETLSPSISKARFELVDIVVGEKSNAVNVYLKTNQTEMPGLLWCNNSDYSLLLMLQP
jgi:hypothetical protein